MLKAIIYTRVSTKRQEKEGFGLSSQEAICREYTDRKGLEVVATFSDSITGGDSKRNGLAEIVTFVRQHKTTQFVVVFDDISRFARDLKGHLEIREKLRRYNCLVVTPSKEFTDDADGLLVENLLASISQHSRMKNQEQVHSRMKGCLLNGYWPFKLPYGYRRRSVSGGRKEILPDEPHFSIARDALQGFAIGKLESQAAVRQFLEAQPAFQKNKNNGDVTFERVNRLLKNMFYSGYFEYPKWEIDITKGQHQPAIDLDTFRVIQKKLEAHHSHPSQLSAEVFPAKGIVICGDCGGSFSACWSAGKLKKYPYYLCFNRHCKSNRKSIPKKEIEDGVRDLLAQAQPSSFAIGVFQAFIGQARKAAGAANSSMRNQLKKCIRENKASIDGLVKRIAMIEEDIVFRLLEGRIRDLRLEGEILIAKLKKLDGSAAASTKLFEHSSDFLANPQNIWENGNIARRHAVVRACFSGPLRFQRNRGFRTPKFTPIFKALQASEDGEDSLAEAQSVSPLFFGVHPHSPISILVVYFQCIEFASHH